MKKRALAALAALCLMLSACQSGTRPEPGTSPAPSEQSAPTGSPVVQRPFALPLDPAGDWDPYGGSRSGNLTLLPLICESLYSLDSAFEPEPLLAQSAVGSEGNRTWTLTLRRGISFSDGTALDAQSVVTAVNAARGEKSLYAQRLAAVKTVTAQDEYTVVFTLSQPNARFPALLDFPIARVTEEGVVGTGPYLLNKHNVLTARSGWWRRAAFGETQPLEQIALVEAGSADALIAAFNASEVSLVADDPTGSDSLGYSGSYQSWEYPTSTMLFLGFQCTRGPGKSKEFRRGVSMALDRGRLLDALGDHAWVAALPVHPACWLYDETLASQVSYDALAAAGALEEAGCKLAEDGKRYSNKRAVSLTLLVNSDNAYKERLAQAIATQLGSVGLSVEVRSLSWEEYKKALNRGDFDLYLAEYRMTGDMDPGALITQGSGLCFGGFRSGELTQALELARTEGGDRYGEFYNLWAQESPQAVLCFKNSAVLTQWGSLSALQPTQGNLFYRFTDWQIS